MGMTQREFQDLLQVRVQVLLLEAVRQDEIRRDLIGRLYGFLKLMDIKGSTKWRAKKWDKGGWTAT